MSGYKTLANKFIRNHDSILFFSKSNNYFFKKNYIYNKDFAPLLTVSEAEDIFKKFGLDKNIFNEFLEFVNHTNRAEKYPIEDTWNCSKWDKLNSVAIDNSTGRSLETVMISDENFKGQKPEALIQRILDSCTNPNDLVLDFFLGSGTTAAVAHKMGRRYIGVEQMDYIEDTTIERLKNVIDGEQGGISKSVKWNGGGNFVYLELKEDAQELIEKVKDATDENINQIKELILKDDRIVPYVFSADIRSLDDEFNTLNLNEQKQALIKLIDKNKLYVNYSSIEDAEYNISENDKNFNKAFYGDK